MIEFAQTMKDWHRMCKAQDDTTCGACESCPMMDNGASCMAVYEDEFDNVDYAHIEQTVTEWTKEHPVVYPTWGEWLTAMGILYHENNPRYFYSVSTKVQSHIPADIAEKLGIKSKEV